MDRWTILEHGGQHRLMVDRRYLRLEGLETLDFDSVHHDSALQGNYKKSQLVLSINLVVTLRASVWWRLRGGQLPRHGRALTIASGPPWRRGGVMSPEN